MKKPKMGLVHCIAECRDCSWREDGYLKARKKALAHYERTGHLVSVEVGYVFEYGERI